MGRSTSPSNRLRQTGSRRRRAADPRRTQSSSRSSSASCAPARSAWSTSSASAKLAAADGRRAANPIPVAAAARGRYGLPAVIRTSPRLPDGTPFPTLYWLSCPAANVAVGRLEAAGWNARLSQRVAADPELRAAHRAAHERYLAQRDALGRLPGDPGVGGLPGRVKCLHTLYAHEVTTGADPVGRLVRQVIEPIDCPGPCVDLADPASS